MVKKKFKEDSQFFWTPKLMGEENDDYKRRMLDDYDVAISILRHDLGLDDEPQERHDETLRRSVKALDVQEGGSHYKTKSIQPIEYIFANGIGFAEGNVIKYVSRWKDKGGIEDLNKARHYLDLLIEAQE